MTYYELLTNFRTNPPGGTYQNYPDRYDVNGGADFGYKLNPQLAVTLGYRYGCQYQQNLPAAIVGAAKSLVSANSDYQRALLGVEGKPWKWLTISLQGGPEFRHYEGNSADHIMPVADQNPVKYYGEAAITADNTSQDALAFKYKQQQWVSSTGLIPYFDSLYRVDLSPQGNRQTFIGAWRQNSICGLYQHASRQQLRSARRGSAMTGCGLPLSGLTYALTPNLGLQRRLLL